MKLQVAAPDSFLVERYLEEIARAYDIKWRSNILIHESDEEEEEQEDVTQNDDDDDDDYIGGGGGGQAEVRQTKLSRKETGTGCLNSLFLQLLPPLQNDLEVDLPEIPTFTPLKKPGQINTNSTPPSTTNNNDDPNDFDALARRLDALKRK